MTLTHRIDGRLGNALSEIFLIFYFARLNNIDTKDIVFNKDKKIYGGEDDTFKKEMFSFSIQKNFPFFKKIESNLITQQQYQEIFKGVKNNTFRILKEKTYDINEKLLICEFCPISYAVDIFNDMNALKLYKDIFYDDDMIDGLRKKYDFCNALGVSVRRGDFITWPGGRFTKYIKTAQQIKDEINGIGHDKIIWFSDDIEWCKENFNGENMIFHENMTPYEDLLLLSLCPNIIANAGSTFSTHARIFNKMIHSNGKVKLI